MNKIIADVQRAILALDNANSWAPCPMYQDALNELKTTIQPLNDIKLALETFCTRVDRGEIRSVQSYARFKKMLEG